MSTPHVDAPGHYNNGHRAFQQAFMSRQTLTFEEAKPILAEILTIQDGRRTLPNDITFQDFTSYVYTLNSALEKFEYEIRYTYPQTATSRNQDTAIYALVNTTSDPETQLATLHTPDEIAFVKRVLDAMFETNNSNEREVMAVKGMDALRLAKVPRDRESVAGATQNTQGGAAAPTAVSLTQDKAEKLLESLIEEGWFQKSRAGYYSLSPRALMELRGWLGDTYNDEDEEGSWQRVKACEGCKEIVTVGVRCANRHCLCRFHDFCAAGFFRTHTDRNCPKCDTDWTGNNFVGERALRGGAVTTNGRTSNAGVTNGQPSHGVSNSRRRPSVHEEEAGEDDDDGETESD